jgi:hypothetical protein
MNGLILVGALLTCGNTSATIGVGDAQREVEREFRLYRIAVYNSFRTQRHEYDARRRAGDEAYAAWKKAGGQTHQTQPLVEWFRAARQVSQPHQLAALPPTPAFPEAIAVAPVPQIVAPRLNNRPAAKAVAKRLPARGNQPAAYRRSVTSKPQPAKPSWQSVSRALLKGMVYGASRAMP